MSIWLSKYFKPLDLAIFNEQELTKKEVFTKVIL